MSRAFRLTVVAFGGSLLAASSMAQIPDLLTSLDAGGHSMGAGGAFYATDADTLSGYYNPAGLGYVDSKQIGATYRNLPSSRSFVGGTLADPVRTTTGQSGGRSLTHLGMDIPLTTSAGAHKGTIGLSYTLGGYIDDNGSGPPNGLPSDVDNSFTVQNFREHRKSRSDFYTLAYGNTNANQTMSYGIGLTLVQQLTQFEQTGTAPITLPSISDTETGVGVIAGLQFIPPKTPNAALGISLRSPISLKNSLYGKIPARLLLGASMRQDAVRGGQDYIVYGAQLQEFFAGESTPYFDRSNQAIFGVGLEYNHAFESFRVPFRVGYVSSPGGGDGYSSRNTFTFGFGYRPNNNDYSIDLNWASPQGGGYDFGLAATYRFK